MHTNASEISQGEGSTTAISIQCAGVELWLLAGRALLLPAARTLVIADVHFGKDEAFRSAGIAIPPGATGSNLARLEKLITRMTPQRLIVLGDFLHAREGRDEAMLASLLAWRKGCKGLEVVLVRGNHDQRAGDPPDELQFQCVHEPFVEPPLAFCHWPCENDGLYSLCGHVHPALSLSDRTGASLRVSCFWFRARSAVLPAFGAFTGRAVIEPRAGERAFAVCDEEVVEVTRACPAAARDKERTARRGTRRVNRRKKVRRSET